MTQVRLLFSEAWASIRMNLSTTFAATMTVLIGMCLLGLFIALGTWVLSWSNHIQKELEVKVLFCTSVVPQPGCATGATQAQEQAVAASLRRQNPLVETVTFKSKEQAYAEMKKKDSAYFKGGIVPANPFPDELVLTPKQGKSTPIIGKQICSAHYPGVAPCPTKGIGDSGGVQWGSTITKHVLTVAKVISLVFLIAVILLVIAATLLIANTIRLSIFARRREIEVMKLVGATNWFIRGPFVLEGLVCGVVGSVFAVILLLLGKTIALPAVIGHLGGNNSDIHSMPFTLNALLIITAGLLLGAAGSGLTLRRFLQV
jgi:cell division transport system permease protein